MFELLEDNWGLRSLLYGGVFVYNWLFSFGETRVSDPCCTAGFLFEREEVFVESLVSDPCCTAGFLFRNCGKGTNR